MIRVGITGQSGFIGSHLYNFLGLKDGVKRIPFEDKFFGERELLENFVRECDVIVHLAAMNRHPDPNVIFETNLNLVQQLISACETTQSKPHILFSSSSQEERENLYGQSKREGRILFEEWAKNNDASFTGLIIPNVFGPFGAPFYNSVIATFCHQLTHEEDPRIEIDGQLKLIYVNELIEVIWQKINETKIPRLEKMEVTHTAEALVSDILALLRNYKDEYYFRGTIPTMDSKFEINLFNTFRCFIPENRFPFLLKENSDKRGSFVEILRSGVAGQYSFSTTKPGVTRGNHFHTRKIERFAVIKGQAEIAIRRIGSNNKIVYQLNGQSPSFVDMPVWCTHNITNTGSDELLTLFWINEPYNPDDPDTWFETV